MKIIFILLQGLFCFGAFFCLGAFFCFGAFFALGFLGFLRKIVISSTLDDDDTEEDCDSEAA